MAIMKNDLLGMLQEGKVRFSVTIDGQERHGVRVASSKWDDATNGKWTLHAGESVWLVHTGQLGAISVNNAPSGNREQAEFLTKLEFQPVAEPDAQS